MGSLGNKASFPSVGQPQGPDDRLWSQRVASALQGAASGKLNTVGTATLINGGVSTTVSDQRCSPNSVVMLMPTSANAQTALAQYSVRTITNGAFTITHVLTATGDCTLGYAILG